MQASGAEHLEVLETHDGTHRTEMQGEPQPGRKGNIFIGAINPQVHRQSDTCDNAMKKFVFGCSNACRLTRVPDAPFWIYACMSAHPPAFTLSVCLYACMCSVRFYKPYQRTYFWKLTVRSCTFEVIHYKQTLHITHFHDPLMRCQTA